MRPHGLALVVVAFAAGCSESVNGKACPYGTNSGASNSSSSTSCKVRPAPKEAERAAVLDGSAWRKGRAAFAATSDARAQLAGIGVNAWGDTTFMRAEGDGDDRLVTYDRAGKRAAADVPDTRRYVVPADGLEGDVRLREVTAAGLPKVLARVRRAEPDARFESATFAKTVSGAGQRWSLLYARAGGGGLIVFARGDGSGACAFQAGRSAGLRSCGPADLLPAGAGEALPEAPSPAANPQLDCVQAAGTDVAKLQECTG